MTEGEESSQYLLSNMAIVTAEVFYWRKLAIEISEELMVALADLALQLALRELAWKGKNTQLTEMTALQKQLAVKGNKLSHLSEKRAVLLLV